MMFIDQPVQVGLSYDTLQNITYNRINGNVTLLNNDTIPEQNTTLAVGTWPSTDTYKTSLGSIDAAYALWHFAQAWFQEFPEHQTTSVSLSGVSYGGKYAPAIFAFFEEQNQKIKNHTWVVKGEQFILPLDTLIIDSGCIDLPHSWFSYPEMAVNNTYGIRAVNDTTLAEMLQNLNGPGGCLEQAYQCGNLSLQYDPLSRRLNSSVNLVCDKAGKFCDRKVQNLFNRSKRSVYDITVPASLSRAPPFSRAYMQRPHVQQALGMRVNWTSGSAWVAEANQRVGDFARPGWVGKLAYLLEQGVKIAFVYGDKDYICVSLTPSHVVEDVLLTDSVVELARRRSHLPRNQLHPYPLLPRRRLRGHPHQCLLHRRERPSVRQPLLLEDLSSRPRHRRSATRNRIPRHRACDGER